MLDVLRTLLGDHQERDTVLAIVSKLVARTTELERRLARGDAPFKVSESAQLLLFLDALKRGDGGPELDDDSTSGEPDESRPPTTCFVTPRASMTPTTTTTTTWPKLRTRRPLRQRASRTQVLAHLRRVDKPMPSPLTSGRARST